MKRLAWWWVGAVYPAETELKISDFTTTDGEVRERQREKHQQDISDMLMLFRPDTERHFTQEAATLFMRDEV